MTPVLNRLFVILRCDCAVGYTGTTCDDDVDECSDTAACFNGGTCVNTVGVMVGFNTYGR